MSRRRVGVYPASFDPITNGHLDLIDRARKLVDELIVAVGVNREKPGTFEIDERLEMIREVLTDRPGCRLETMSGLLVDFAREHGARIVIRGLRAHSDFEEEFEMALMNAHMMPEIETVFLMTSERWFYVTASRIRELAKFGANVSEWVPPVVLERLNAKLGKS